MERRALSKRLRFEIFKRDGFRCLYCGATPAKSPLQVDHIVPVVKGGTNDPGNLVTSCRDCNLGKFDGGLSEKRIPGVVYQPEPALTAEREILRLVTTERDELIRREHAAFRRAFEPPEEEEAY